MDNNQATFLTLVGVYVLVCITCVMIFWLRTILKKCRRRRRVGPVAYSVPAETQNEPRLELQPPTYEEATSDLPRRRRISPKETPSHEERGNIGARLPSGEATGDRNPRDGGNGGEYSGARTHTTDDSGIKLNPQDDSDMTASSKYGGNTSTANDSGARVGGGGNSIDKLDADSTSKYDTASEASGGSFRKDSTAPLPWSSF